MDDGARGWLFRTATKNYWRIARWYDLDDLIQDGYVCYCKVLQRYPDATDAPHRMALFKRTYMNWITDLANKRTKSVQETLDCDAQSAADLDGPPMSFLAGVPCPQSGMVELDALMASAPEVVRRALALFTTEEGRRAMRAAYRLRADGTRETMNDRVCRLLGLAGSTFDVVGAVRQWLGTPASMQVTVDWRGGRREVVVERRARGRKYVGVELLTGPRVALCERSEKYVPVDKDVRSQSRAVLRLPAVAR